VPSGARRGCLATIERAGVGFTPRCCAATPFVGVRRVGAAGLGLLRCAGGCITAGCAGAGANQRHARYPTIAAAMIPNIIFMPNKGEEFDPNRDPIKEQEPNAMKKFTFVLAWHRSPGSALRLTPAIPQPH